MKSSLKIFLQVLIWGILLLFPLYVMNGSSSNGGINNTLYLGYLIRTCVLAALFYINYLYLIDKFLFNKKLWTYVIINTVLVITSVFAQTGLFETLHNEMPKYEMRGEIPVRPDGSDTIQSQSRFDGGERIKPGPPHFRDRQGPDGFFTMRIFSDFLPVVLIIALSVALKVTYRWYHDSIKLQETKSIQLEADLKNLRSQLNPHFLFNTLNNIYSLIAIDKNKAQDAVHRLSGLLRFVLYDNDERFVPVQKELQFTENYIDLAKLRVSSNVKVNILIEGHDSQDKVASLMFMTLIENAFKHGISRKGECFIDISIVVEKGKGVVCTVENSLAEEDDNNLEKNKSGIGLANLSKRLNLLYPDKHEFVTEKRPESFYAMLRINFT